MYLIHKASLALAGLALVLLLAMAGCGTDSQVSGVVTDTHWWTTGYPCGKSTCFSNHHSFIVNGREYQDDWDDVRTGDHVAFTYNTVMGVSNLTDSTVHHDESAWLLVVLVLAILAGATWYGWHRWRSASDF